MAAIQLNRANTQAGFSENRWRFSSGLRLRRILFSVSDSEPMARRILLSRMPRFHALVSPQPQTACLPILSEGDLATGGDPAAPIAYPPSGVVLGCVSRSHLHSRDQCLTASATIGVGVVSHSLVRAQPFAPRHGERQPDPSFRSSGSRCNTHRGSCETHTWTREGSLTELTRRWLWVPWRAWPPVSKTASSKKRRVAYVWE